MLHRWSLSSLDHAHRRGRDGEGARRGPAEHVQADLMMHDVLH